MATQYDPIAKDESLNTTELSPRNIADVLAEELDAIAQAIGGGGGSGGHTIIAPDGTEMTQRAGLDFVDAHISDDAVNDETVVEITEVISQSDFDDLDETDSANEGQYLVEIPNNAPILNASQVGYGTETVKDALDELQPMYQIISDTNSSISVAGKDLRAYKMLMLCVVYRNAVLTTTIIPMEYFVAYPPIFSHATPYVGNNKDIMATISDVSGNASSCSFTLAITNPSSSDPQFKAVLFGMN